MSIESMVVNPSSLTVTAEHPRDADVAARLTRSLRAFAAEVRGQIDVTPQMVQQYLLAQNPDTSKAAVIAIAHGLPIRGLPKGRYIARCWEQDRDGILDEARDIMTRVRQEIAGETYTPPTDPSADRGQVIVCMSRGLYWSYVRVDGKMCEPGSPMALELGERHWAPRMCRNINRILHRVQGYLLGETGIEEYLDTMEDRELVDAIAAGAQMDEKGRIG